MDYTNLMELEATTKVRNIKVSVRVTPRYLRAEETDTGILYFFAYDVKIANNGETSFQLLSRFWTITDAHNSVEEVEGLGVIGEQPYITPGNEHRYSSYVALPTPFGIMSGHYTLENENGERVLAEIPLFNLAAPNKLH